MSGGGGGDPNADKNALTIVWAVFLIFFLCWMIWYFFQDFLLNAFLTIRLVEAKGIALFSDQGDLIEDFIYGISPHSMSLDTAAFVSNLVGDYYLYPSVFIIGLMIFHLMTSHVNMRYNKAHDMKSLAQQEQKNWPQIAPVVSLDLVGEEVREGPWAMSMTPLQFVKQYNMVDIEELPDRKSPWKTDGTYKMILNHQRARWVFINQLGPLWEGIDKLPEHTLAIFAILSARIEHNSDAARLLMGQLATSAAKGRVNYTGAMQLLSKHVKNKAVQRATERHAYVTTVMATMLELAREDGVQASADFLWLKPVDRRLWYVLNMVGRRAALPEVAGIYAHWRSEQELARPLNVPQIDMAVQGLEFALTTIAYVPGEDEELPMADAG